MKHNWGFYCEDRENSRVLVIKTNKHSDDPDLRKYLADKFTEFIRQYESTYICDPDCLYYLAINIVE